MYREGVKSRASGRLGSIVTQAIRDERVDLVHARAEAPELDLLCIPADEVGIRVLPLCRHLRICARVDENVERACERGRISVSSKVRLLKLSQADSHFSSITGKNVTLAVIWRMMAWISW